MAEDTNLERLKAAYAAWHDSKGANENQWLDLFSDNIRMRSVGDQVGGLEFAGEYLTKQQAVSYFTGLLETWEMIHWTPERFVVDGDQIAMFGRCAWKHRATGKDIEISIAHLWTFEGNVAIEAVEVFDSARAAMAAVP